MRLGFSAAKPPLLLFTFLASAASAAVLPTDLIVDEFDDPVSFDFPIPAGQPNFVVQDGVGPLGAMRRADVTDRRTRASGQLVIGDSLLRATVTGADPFAATSPTLTGHVYNLIYNFSSPVDLAAAGLDAIAVDFRVADSSFGFIPRVTLFTQGVDFPGASFASERFRTPLSDSPFTLLFPLEDFTLRGGGGGVPPTTLFQVHLSISADTFFTLPDSDLAFSAVVERIRFTTLVPEPSAALLVTVGCSLFGLFGPSGKSRG